MTRNTLLAVASFSLAFAGIACSGADVDDAPASGDDAVSSEEALTSGASSGYAQCPGLGWSTRIEDWKGVKGSYGRAGIAAARPGDFTTLTVLADPSEANQGTPGYTRTTVGAGVETGTVVLGTDNPAIGPALVFRDKAGESRDIHWVVAQKRNMIGKIVGICLIKAWTPSGNAEDENPYMITRVGP